MHGDIASKMCEGIDDSAIILVFITEKYLKKVASSGDDNCKSEFMYAVRSKGAAKVIAVVNESSCQDTKEWKGPCGMYLGGRLYCRMWDNDMKPNIDKLIEEIWSCKASK